MEIEKYIPSWKVYCPKCKTAFPNITDLYINHSIEFSGNDSGKYDEGILEPGDFYKQVARCRNCGHMWTIRRGKYVDMDEPTKNSHKNTEG